MVKTPKRARAHKKGGDPLDQRVPPRMNAGKAGQQNPRSSPAPGSATGPTRRQRVLSSRSPGYASVSARQGFRCSGPVCSSASQSPSALGATAPGSGQTMASGSLPGPIWARSGPTSPLTQRRRASGPQSPGLDWAQRAHVSKDGVDPAACEPPGPLGPIGRIGRSDYYRHPPLGRGGYRAGEDGRARVR